MNTELQMLSDRITALEVKLNELSSYLKEALNYAATDAQSSLTKSRIVLEKLIQSSFCKTGNKRETNKRMLGEMLSNKEITGGIPARILTRMNAIRDMSNLGPHGGEVNQADAARVMRDLLDVLEWYVDTRIATPPSIDLNVGQEIEKQVELMKGYPLSYLQGLDEGQILKLMGGNSYITGSSHESLHEIALRSAFPQFLDWLRAQTPESESEKR